MDRKYGVKEMTVDALNPASPTSDYELKVDEQVQKFLELNHTLTFFLVTASVGSLGFTLTYAKEHELQSLRTWLLIAIFVAAVLALTAAWAGLRALRFDQESFRLHLKYRYQRRTWDDLQPGEQFAWEAINRKASGTRQFSFKLLVATVVAQASFLLCLLAIQGDIPMHHYGEDSTSVVVGDALYHLEFKNKVSGATISMSVPAVGSLEDPQKRLDPAGARRLADEIAHLLRRVLG